jgi:hypothetical protein
MADWDDWEPVRRVGAPEFKASGSMVKVRVWTKGRSHEDWRGYFMSQVSQLRLDATYDGHFSADRDTIHGSCGQDDPKRYIEMLDSAIDYANTKFARQPAKPSFEGIAEHEGGRRGQAPPGLPR